MFFLLQNTCYSFIKYNPFYSHLAYMNYLLQNNLSVQIVLFNFYESCSCIFQLLFVYVCLLGVLEIHDFIP